MSQGKEKMKNIFNIIKDRFADEYTELYYQQEKAQRIAVTAAYISQEIFVKKPLRMSAIEFYNATLLYRVKGDCLKVAAERNIELSDVQREVLSGKKSMELDIIKLAETIVAVRSNRIYNGQNKMAITNFGELKAELYSDKEINKEVLSLLGDHYLAYLYDFEKLIRANWEVSIFPC